MRRARRKKSGRGARVAAALAGVLLAAVMATAAVVLWRVRPSAITIGSVTVILRTPPDPEARARQRIHEAVHRMQFRREGLLGFAVAYLADAEQRLAWEAEAYAANLCLARHEGPHHVALLERAIVDQLPGYVLLRTVAWAEAHAHLREAYRYGRICDELATALEPEEAARLSALGRGSPGAGAP